jgi:hypothetical protein
MTLISDAAGLVAGPYLVNEQGVPVSDDRIMAFSELICETVGLHAGFVHPVAAHIIQVGRAETYTRLHGGDVLVCTATGCPVVATYYSKGRAVCGEHIGWEPGRSLCSLNGKCADLDLPRIWTKGNHHLPDCPMWEAGAMSAEALAEWEAGST